ncbi:MAG: YfhO family protein [Ilumatobacteraceae bacterium]
MGADASRVDKTGEMVTPSLLGTARRRRCELVVAAVAVWAGRSFWMPGGVVTSYDGATYSMPNTEVTRAALAGGRVPVLNDQIFGGVPHLGNHAVGVFYPPRLVALLFDTATGHGLVVAAHLVFLGVGITVLARHLRLSGLAAGAAGTTGVLAGATLTKTIQYEQIQPVAWLPWMMLAVLSVGVAGAPRRRVGLLALVTAMTLLSGHPQLVIEVAVVAAAVAVGAVVSRHIGLGRLVVGVGVGALMCAVQIVATLSARSVGALEQGRTFDDLANGAFILQARAIARAVFGTVLDRDPAAFSGAFEAIVWIGVVASVLVFLGGADALAQPDRRFWSVPVVAMAALGLIWSLGPRTPVFRVAYAVIPGFDLGRVSARWLVISAVLAALLVGVGVDAVSNVISRRRALAGSGLAVVVILFVVGPLSSGSRTIDGMWITSVVVVVAAIRFVRPERRSTVLVALLMVEMTLLSLQALPGRLVLDEAVGTAVSPAIGELQGLAASGGLVVALTPDGGPHDELVLGLRPNSNVWFGLRSIDGYDGGVQVTEDWAAMLRRFTPEPALDMPLRSSLSTPVSPSSMARLGVRWMVVARDRDPAEWVPDWIGPVAEDERLTIWENPAWIADAVAWFDSASPVGHPADDLRMFAASFGQTVLAADAPVSCSGACPPVGLELERVSAEHLVVSGQVDQSAILTVPVQAIPGWTATVNGELSPVVKVDGLFIGVLVEPGDHSIVLRYQPGWWWPSAVVSVVAISIALVLIVDRRRRVTS